ncbi:MAG: hypothetical protein DMF91_08090 [Acidobacteria bacterium]|nr:MAG: hypothetical protein DMF91_08090 [Acidobacteriota bacterium]
MRRAQTLGLRLRSLFRSIRVDRELDVELRFHLDEQIERNVAAGMTPADARTAALREFGGVDQIKEACRDERRVTAVDHLARDVRYALRVLRREPGFSVVAIATVALGIGVTTAMFTILHAVLLKPLPYRDPDRLAMVYSVLAQGPFRCRDCSLSDAAFFELKRGRTFRELAAFGTQISTLTGVGDPVRVHHSSVTANLLSLLGVGPAIGQGFQDGDDTTGRSHVALVSDRLWRSHFGADPAILGKPIRLNGESYTVVGVMPAGFSFPNEGKILMSPDVWTPLVLDPAYDANAMRRVVGRLAPGATAAAATTELESLLQHPTGGHLRHTEQQVRVEDLKLALVGDVERLLWLLAGVVACVLLVACANVANLLLARGASRKKELALRGTLGASRVRLVQQLLTESLVLAAIGGVAGLLVARWSLALTLPLVPSNKLPRMTEIVLNANGFAFAALLCLITALVIGAIPACSGSNVDVNEALQEGSDRSSAPGVTRVRSLLVVAEIALVLVLLTGAGLLVKSFWRLHNVDPGFNAEGVLTMQIEVPERVYQTIEQRKRLYDQVLTRLQAVPGGVNVSAINLLPFGEMGWAGDFEIEGGAAPRDLLVGKPAISDDYFRALGIRLLRGRHFDRRDAGGAPRVAIVSDIVARRCWPGGDPIGRRLAMDSSRPDSWLTVVGVVADVKPSNLAARPQPMIYVPIQQEWRRFFLANMAFLVRVTGSREVVAAGLRRAVNEVDTDLPVSNVAMLDQLLARSVSAPRFRASLFVAFAGLALTLACVGIAGLVAYDVTRRTREIGIRLALGAQPGDVVGMVMKRSVSLIATGIALGLAMAFALSRLLADFLFDVKPDDPATFAMVALAITVAAAAAAFVPARRATRIQPVIALRYE